MNDTSFFFTLLYAWTGIALVLFPVLFFVSAPYGRHTRAGWGLQIPSWLGWVLMEAPSPIGMVVLFVVGDRHDNPVALALLGLWLLHYVNRAFVFPLRIRGGEKPMPLVVALSAVGFNSMNAYLNGRWLFKLAPLADASVLHSFHFVVGAALFVLGFYINLKSDSILRHLRAPGETGYKIPRGGLYGVVSCPNYFGEILEWIGFALASLSLASLTFLIWTAANLIPRAITNHKWYRAQFPDYPSERKAVIPYVL